MKGKGLFAIPASPDEEEGGDLAELEDDFADDLEDDAAAPQLELDGGAFSSYAETVFDTNADPLAREDALKQAILTLVEEQRRGAL